MLLIAALLIWGSFGAPFYCMDGTDTFCRACDGVDGCTLCVNSYINRHGFCSPVPLQTVANCLHYANEETCVACAPGYYLREKQCKLLSNCVYVDGFGDCVTCPENSVLGFGASCTSSRSCLIPNCKWCGGLGTGTGSWGIRLNSGVGSGIGCELCKTGYVLAEDGLSCVEAAGREGCQLALGNGCKICADGYFINGSTGTCSPSPNAIWYKSISGLSTSLALFLFLLLALA